MSAENNEGFDPLIFRQYRKLAGAILNRYYLDKDAHFRKLKQQKKILLRRLEYGSNTLLVKRNYSPLEAWESWNASINIYDEFIKYEQSDDFNFYYELSTCVLNKEI